MCITDYFKLFQDAAQSNVLIVLGTKKKNRGGKKLDSGMAVEAERRRSL